MTYDYTANASGMAAGGGMLERQFTISFVSNAGDIPALEARGVFGGRLSVKGALKEAGGSGGCATA